MPGKQTINILLLLMLSFIITERTLAQDLLEKCLWYNTPKTAKLQIYKAADGKFYGKIAWLLEPNEQGKPKVDKNNPDKARRNDPLMGLVLLKGFTKTEEGLYEDGTIYDPKNGKTYSCKMTYKNDKLEVRGFIGFSLLGRTEVWTKAN